MGRHHPGSGPAMRWPTITPTRNRIAVLSLASLGLTVCSVVGIGDSWAPDGRAATSAPMSFPTTDQADAPGARGGPIAPIFDDAPRYDPGKDGALIVDGLPLDHPRSTGSTATRATRATPTPSAFPLEPAVDAPTDVAPPPAPPVIVEPLPAPGDPLHDDGEFGDGCEQPGTSERCDPVVGLPPVVDEEEEPAVDEEPAVEPPADDTPVVDIGILTPDPAEVAP